MSDLVKRLRMSAQEDPLDPRTDLLEEAATAIENLNSALLTVLEGVVDYIDVGGAAGIPLTPDQKAAHERNKVEITKLRARIEAPANGKEREELRPYAALDAKGER